jgi:ABC-type multidrug transport system ATPase subunit
MELRLARAVNDGALSRLDCVTECHALEDVYVLHSTRAPQTLVALVKYLEAQNNELQSLEIKAPSLEDVFIELTGRRLRD